MAKQKTKFKRTEIGEIPEDWEVSTLDEISLKVTDGSHYSPKESEKGNKIIATVRDMEYYQFSFKNCKRIADEDFNLLVKNGCSPEKGDIIISKDGANCLDLIFVYNQDKKIVLLSSIAIVKLKKGFNPQFYRYYLLSPVAQKIMKEGYVSGSAIPRVILKDFKKVPIPILPNIETQNKIADILSSLDDKIALNLSMNTTLEAIGQALFRRWFVDFEFLDGEGKPYRSSGGDMVDSELGEVPRGWRVGTVGEVLELSYGKALKDENRHKGNVPVYGSNGQIGWHNEKFVEGPGIVVGRKGNPGIVTWSHKAFFPIDTTFYVVPKAIRSMYYLFYILHLQDLQSLGADSAVPGLNRNVVYMNKMIVPSSETLEIFDAFLGKIYNKVQNNNEQSDILTEIRDALLPKLMSGEIRVIDAEGFGKEISIC
jgi:type I restriction enzyme S subunit